jgi:MYXO-CTERM domain-containing protein
VFAWRRPRGLPSQNTGHVGIVLDRPLPVPGLPFPGRGSQSRGTPGTDSGCNATGAEAPAGALLLFALSLLPLRRRR